MKTVKIYCGVPDCGLVFDSLEEYNEHYNAEHLIHYGVDGFGVHPKIEVLETKGDKLFTSTYKIPSNDPHDWVYEATYKDGVNTKSFKFNPLKGVDPLESARNIVFQQYKNHNGAISEHRYTTYLNAQVTLRIKTHHEIIN